MISKENQKRFRTIGEQILAQIQWEREEADRREKKRRNCNHEEYDTYTECIDYHKRDFGTFCKNCDALLDSNG